MHSKKYLVEFIGTFFLVFTVGMTVIGNIALAPLAIGISLGIMVYAGGYVSGGHYNPAVSFAVLLRGKLSLLDFIAYVIAQVAAGLVAAYAVIYFTGGITTTPPILDPIKIVLAEGIFTFALCYVVLNVATAEATKGNSFYGLAIGLTVFVGACAVGTISGGAFNPAVVAGITLMKIAPLSNVTYYLTGNFAGAALAALVFKITGSGYEKKLIVRFF